MGADQRFFLVEPTTFERDTEGTEVFVNALTFYAANG